MAGSLKQSTSLYLLPQVTSSACFFAGVTILKMTSGERIDVKETPEEIIAMLTEGASK